MFRVLPRHVVIALALWFIIGARALYAAPPAQPGDLIGYGDTVPGTISEAMPCAYYRFEGAAGDPVVIDVARTGGDLDATLALFRGDGADTGADPVAENDDRPGGGLDPLLDLQLPATDRYAIRVCRLQAGKMRITTGTFTLTLTGPDAPASSAPATPAGALSDSVFGSPSGAEPTPTPPASPLLGMLTGQGDAVLHAGDTLNGTLDADTPSAAYNLPVHAGDVVTLVWTRTEGDLAPRLLVTDPSARLVAQAAAPDALSELTLTFTAPHDDTLRLSVTRYADALDESAGAYTLAVAVDPLPDAAE